jgi:hypothetical protein
MTADTITLLFLLHKMIIDLYVAASGIKCLEQNTRRQLEGVDHVVVAENVVPTMTEDYTGDRVEVPLNRQIHHRLHRAVGKGYLLCTPS